MILNKSFILIVDVNGIRVEAFRSSVIYTFAIASINYRIVSVICDGKLKKYIT